LIGVTQLLVRLPLYNFYEAAAENKLPGLTGTPACFYLEKLLSLSIYQIVFFDEVHKKQEIGSIGDTVVSFPRNLEWIFDENGSVAEVERKLHTKYVAEGPF
jgi:hypothetical protein